ncbi:MAG: thiosulfate/3-mercaptopyruvate sulfurtransferase [Frankiaceae bacterium]|nr:thiosulfate/3-mercaptopyruvate sulfurtransferase [Frankiaceae bacterium]
MSIPPIVSAAWLAEHFEDVVVADVRWYPDGTDPFEAYRASHLWGAVFVDVDHDLAAPASAAAGRHPMPTPEAFAATMSRLGIGDDTTVIAYDDQHGSRAARLVWMLRVLGHPAAVLDGGMLSWRGAKTSGDPVALPPAAFTAAPWPADRIATADDVAALGSGAVLIDARQHARFTGDERNPLDPQPGHIPGAVNLEWPANMSETGHFLPADRLRTRYAAVAGADDVVVYCGSGVTGCHDVLALEAIGVENVRLYPGSYSQWASDPERPIATGE